MNVNEALEKAMRVLDEEQTRWTVGYRYVSNAWPRNKSYQQFELQHQKGWTPAMAAQVGLGEERSIRPRHVYEDPKLYLFESANFDLLVRIFSQVREDDREAFVSALLQPVREPGVGRGNRLITEFLIRTGHLKELLAALHQPTFPTMSLSEILTQLEEIMALNFNVFSDSELVSIPTNLAHLRGIASRHTSSGPSSTPAPLRIKSFAEAGRAIVRGIDGIVQECKQARYWYLKGALQEIPNLEIESDKLKVEGFLAKLGFNPDMVKTLNEAERDYKTTSTPFELKNCLSHLRSFLEHLHREAAKSIAAVAGDKVLDKWGDATIYLRQQNYFSLQHEKFSASLYTLLSDESVHPLTAEREYARLIRNVVIEYGVMFLSVLDKRGVKI